ncbi:cob(I)yrinic acid a,c-diamide adenosyltransferase [Patescibacteria group bacterium]|nr:cob(I)yrinic acid a,c-diamide adenosyltransferase [Patescibacteria group bacterium]
MLNTLYVDIFMILVITGNGKGKTTSALGTAIRASGWEKKVAIVFLDKGGSHYGEGNILEMLQDKIEVYRFGLDRFNEKTQEFRFTNTKADEDQANLGIEKIHTLYKQDYFMIVCDEVLTALNVGLVKDVVVRELVDKCPKNTNLILTGRNAPAWLVKKADMVSEVNEVKHHFQQTKKAIKGIDY